MSDKTITIASEFSPSPAGRYKSDGPFSGEAFREGFLLPALKNHEVVTIILDGTDGFGSSFLEEAFGGLVRTGYTEDILRRRLNISSKRKSYEARVWNYIHEGRSSKSNSH